MSHRLLISIAVAYCIFVSAVTYASNETATTKILPNGAHVTLITDTLSDIAAFHLALPVSQMDIPEAKAGIRDVIQQIIIDRLSNAMSEGGELHRLADIMPSGVKIDVTAEMEYIEIRVSVPAAFFQDVFAVVCTEVFAECNYTPEQIAAAKNSVTQAYEQNSAAVAERTYRLFTRALYGKSPLTRDLATILSGIGAITRDDIAACRKSFYAPSRAYLTIVSPASHNEMTAIAEHILGNYGKLCEPQVITWNMPIASESDIQVASDTGLGQASLMIGVPLPPYGTHDFLAGQVAFMLLAGTHGILSSDQMLHRGFGLMLPRNVYEQQPPFEVIAPRPASVPFIAVHIIANPSYIEDARAAVLRHFAALQRGEFTEAEFAEAKAQLTNRYAHAHSTYVARAQLVNLNTMFGGNLDASMEFEQAIKSISIQEVTNLANTKFNHHAIGIQMPGI